MRQAKLCLLFALVGCAGPGSESVPDAHPAAKPAQVLSSQIGGDDSDYAADPKKPLPQHEGPLSFHANTERALDEVAQGQHGRYGTPRSTLEEAECQALLTEAQGKEPACTRELYAANCGRGATFKPAECQACAELYKADDALQQAGCPPRPIYPTLRIQ